MKHFIWMLVLFVSAVGFAQDVDVCEKELLAIASRRSYFDQLEYNGAFEPIDSINAYNERLALRLLQCTKTKESLLNPFVRLEDENIGLTTSPDGLFKIYSWDDQTGGTMRYAINVFQYSNGSDVFSQLPTWLEEEDPDDTTGFFYSILDEVVSAGKTFYVVKCIFIGSSAVSVHKIKIFSIDNTILNDKAVLIKTKTGIRNELGYEVDFSQTVNHARDVPARESAWIQYDTKTKTIAIPLLREDGKLTAKKIRYRFNGTYFERI